MPKYSPTLTVHTLYRNSVLFPDDIRIVRFIHCKNAYALAELAKQYMWFSIFNNKPFVYLAKSIFCNDRSVIDALPQSFVMEVREWIRFFHESVIEDELLKHRVAGPSLEFRIINTEIYNDNVYKLFVPFTNLYKLTKYEKNIEEMMKEITEAAYGKPIYVSFMMPLAKNDIPIDEDNIARDILSERTT
jgi:hypothetical protein